LGVWLTSYSDFGRKQLRLLFYSVLLASTLVLTPTYFSSLQPHNASNSLAVSFPSFTPPSLPKHANFGSLEQTVGEMLHSSQLWSYQNQQRPYGSFTVSLHFAPSGQATTNRFGDERQQGTGPTSYRSSKQTVGTNATTGAIAKAIEVSPITPWVDMTIVSVGADVQTANGYYEAVIYSSSSGKPSFLLASSASTAMKVGFNYLTLSTPYYAVARTQIWIGFECSASSSFDFYHSLSGTSYGVMVATYGAPPGSFGTPTVLTNVTFYFGVTYTQTEGYAKCTNDTGVASVLSKCYPNESPHQVRLRNAPNKPLTSMLALSPGV